MSPGLPATSGALHISDIMQFLEHVGIISISQQIQDKLRNFQKLLKGITTCCCFFAIDSIITSIILFIRIFSHFLSVIIQQTSWYHGLIVTILQQITHGHNIIKVYWTVYEPMFINFWYGWPKWSFILLLALSVPVTPTLPFTTIYASL